MIDISLCAPGDTCPIKEKCLRYQLYQQALKGADGELHWHVEPQYEKGCVNFISNE